MMDDEKKTLLRKHGASEIYIVLSSLINEYRKLLENPMYITIRAALLMAASNFGAWWLINAGWSKLTTYMLLLLPLMVYIFRPRYSKKHSFGIEIIMALEWVFCFMWMIVFIRLCFFPITSDYDDILFLCMLITGPVVLFTSPNFIGVKENNVQKKIQKQSVNTPSNITNILPEESKLRDGLTLPAILISCYLLFKGLGLKDDFLIISSTFPWLFLYLAQFIFDIDHHRQLKKYLEKHYDATHLDFSNRLNFNLSNLITACEFIKTSNTLVSISLSKNNITDSGIEKLVEALKVNKTLSSIDLSSNILSNEGFLLLIEALKINQNITQIDLSNVNMHNFGAKALANLLLTNKSITSISLCNNKIDDLGAIALARSLKVNTTLKRINLKDNDITIEGILALKEVTKVNVSLSIDLNYIRIDSNETNVL